MERLVNISEIMHEQDQRHRFGYGAAIVLWFFTFQHSNTERNHMNDIERRSSNVARRILFVAEYGNICKVKFVMRRYARRIRLPRLRIWIRSHKRSQLILQRLMPRKMKTVWVPVQPLDLVRKRRDSLQSQPIKKLVDLPFDRC